MTRTIGRRDTHGRDSMRFWLIVAGTFAVTTVALVFVGAPSPYLFAGVLAGGVCALSVRSPRKMPDTFRGVTLGIIGVQAGSMIDSSVVATLAAHPLVTLGSAVATLAVTLVFGQLLRISPHVRGSTATFASIAGGASGLTAMARELKADEATVVSVQYLRVLVVVLSVPLIAPLLGGGGAGSGITAGHDGYWSGLPFTVVSLLVGLALARVLTFTASKLMLPMVVALALTLLDVFPSHDVPVPILAAGFAAIGLMVGLDLTREVLRKIATIMPLALISLLLSLAACAGIGVLMARALGVSVFTGYLATTPGGLPAVTAFALEAGTDVGLIVTCQVLRLFLALAMGVAMAAYIQRRASGPDSAN